MTAVHPERPWANGVEAVRILAPLGMLGYGYPLAHFEAGLARDPHLIAVDAGSTDGGPHKLGKGVGIVSEAATRRDLEPMLRAAVERGIPVVVGTAGGSGSRLHVEWARRIVAGILSDHGWAARVAVIDADVPPDRVVAALAEGDLRPLRAVPEADEATIRACPAIVAQMGVEPIVAALEQGADIVLCGRSYDPTMFAALPIMLGFPAGLAFHMGKILECGAQCAIPGAASDCMIGTLDHEGFVLEPLGPERRCTPTSVAAHTLYEKSDPARLPGPGGDLVLDQCRFEAVSDRAVRVTGSRFEPSDEYRVKLEGSAPEGYRAICIAGLRDPQMIARLDECLDAVRKATQEFGGFAGEAGFGLNFLCYGRDAVLGESEPLRDAVPHEVGVVIDAVGPTQTDADALCSLARSSLLHYHYTGRKATGGNLAFPFAPSDFQGGPVFRFALYHTMKVRDGLELFPIRWIGEEGKVGRAAE
ncbi:MAG: acyclic terpene utilization AtuA family protein [Acetobacterales bacterium]